MRSKKKAEIRVFSAASLVGLIIAVWCGQSHAHQTLSQFKKPVKVSAAQIQAPGLRQEILELAVKAYNKAKQEGKCENEHLTVVDYSLPSTSQRLWVINMSSKKATHITHVAHGIGSGQNYAYRFSNNPGSHMSSLGVFVTGKMYKGNYGDSLQLHGLEDKFNGNAFTRRIVIHQAYYVNEYVIDKIGRLGRSFGCLALNTKIAKPIMNTIKGGSLVFCYYPDKAWLSESTMLS